jgi:ATP-dependent protease ClpP protease subunit
MRRLTIVAILAVALGAAATPAPADPVVYLEVPIEGHLGADAVPDGLRHCLEWASQSPRITHVVLRIHSTGGSAEAAGAMLQALEASAGRFTYHAFVQAADGPAAAVALACDTIHMAPEARIGGGLNLEDPAAEKVVPRAVVAAAGKKHPVAVARALLQRRAQAFAWADEKRNVHTAETLPEGTAGEKVVLRHDGQRALVLSADQAVAVGLADGRVAQPDHLGTALRLPSWHSAGDYAVKAMQRMKVNRERALAKAEKEQRERQERLAANIEKRQALVTYIQQNIDEAKDNEPEEGTYAVELDMWGDLDFTWESKRRWRERAERAMEAWQRVQQATLALAALEKEAESLGAPRVMHGLNLKQIHDRAGREIERLKDAKYRTAL